MSRFPLHRAASVLIVVLGLAAFAAGDPPKDQPAKDDAPGTKRLLYIVKHGTAKDLAPVLASSFKGVAEVQAAPDPTSNCLLITAAPAALDEVVTLLQQIDRRPQTTAVEIWILEMGAKRADGDKAGGDVDEKDLSGMLADVNARVDALEKKGAFVAVKRIRLTALEGQPASVTIGENKPFVAGVHMTGTGVASRNITYRNMGVKAEASVRVSPEKVVTVDLKLEDSHAYMPEGGVSIGTDENGKPVVASEFMEYTLSSKMDIPSDMARLAEGVTTNAKSGTTHTVIVVGAQVIESDTKPEK